LIIIFWTKKYRCFGFGLRFCPKDRNQETAVFLFGRAQSPALESQSDFKKFVAASARRTPQLRQKKYEVLN